MKVWWFVPLLVVGGIHSLIAVGKSAQTYGFCRVFTGDSTLTCAGVSALSLPFYLVGLDSFDQD